MREPLPCLALGALFSLLPGCFLFFPYNPPPDPAGGCEGTSFDGPEPAETRGAALGEGLGTDFRPYQPGDTVTLVVGPQGATMLTPVVRVEATGETADVCAIVRLTTDYVRKGSTTPGGAGGSGGMAGAAGGGGASGSDAVTSQSTEQLARFSLSHGNLLSAGTFYDPLVPQYAPAAYDLRLTVHVRAASFTASQTITVQGQ